MYYVIFSSQAVWILTEQGSEKIALIAEICNTLHSSCFLRAIHIMGLSLAIIIIIGYELKTFLL